MRAYRLYENRNYLRICFVNDAVYAKDRRIIGYISVNVYREIKINSEDRLAAASTVPRKKRASLISLQSAAA